jgi:hypothetical protein
MSLGSSRQCALTRLARLLSFRINGDLLWFPACGIEGPLAPQVRPLLCLTHGAAGAARCHGGGIVQKRGRKSGGTGLGSNAMSQREVVWILLGAVLIAAAGAGAFVVATHALSLF